MTPEYRAQLAYKSGFCLGAVAITFICLYDIHPGIGVLVGGGLYLLGRTILLQRDKT